MSDLFEISDLVWPLDPEGYSAPVHRDRVLDILRNNGQFRAVNIVAGMPHHNGLIQGSYLADLAVRVHAELGRLAEELQLAARVAEVLQPLVARIQSTGRGDVTVVDLGCGMGQLLRTLAAKDLLGEQVHLVGVDLNAHLIARARKLAAVESERVQFVVGDAFKVSSLTTGPARTIMISTGSLHHVPAAALPGFFAAHTASGVAGFSHWDITPGRATTFGAWVFHRARARERVTRHDGVVSARRAHPSALLSRAASAATGFHHEVLDEPGRVRGLLQVLRPVQGWRA